MFLIVFVYIWLCLCLMPNAERSPCPKSKFSSNCNNVCFTCGGKGKGQGAGVNTYTQGMHMYTYMYTYIYIISFYLSLSLSLCMYIFVCTMAVPDAHCKERSPCPKNGFPFDTRLRWPCFPSSTKEDTSAQYMSQAEGLQMAAELALEIGHDTQNILFHAGTSSADRLRVTVNKREKQHRVGGSRRFAKYFFSCRIL